MNKRLFIGIPVKSVIAEHETGKWRSNSQLSQNRMSWTKPDNWHITLYFLGNTLSERIPLLTELIAQSFESVNTFTSELKEVGVFPNQQNPKVLWLGLQTLSPVVNAYQQLGELLKQNGFAFDEKPLKPHLTIARIKSIENSTAIRTIHEQYSGFSFGSAAIDRIVLFESILTQEGPVYKPLFVKTFQEQ